MSEATTELVWLTDDLVQAMHARRLEPSGGPVGLRDEGALEPTLGRPLDRAAYGSADRAALAAACAFGIAQNHPFIAGNTPAALLFLVTFLGLNDVDLPVDEAEAVVMIRVWRPARSTRTVSPAGFATGCRRPEPSPEPGPGAPQPRSALASPSGALISGTTRRPS